MKILLIEDDIEISEMLCSYLIAENFEVVCAADGQKACEAFDIGSYSIVLLDLMIPQITGMNVMKYIRQKSTVPIIIISAKDSDSDKTLGLGLGADDYITKPFSVLEIISRVRAILRRCSVDDRQDVIKLGQIVFDDSKHIVTSCGEECNLTFKEYELLKYLLKNKRMALTRENIILNVWGYDFEGESRTVDMHITTLRQKLGSCGNLIKTVRNVGYKAGE